MRTQVTKKQLGQQLNDALGGKTAAERRPPCATRGSALPARRGHFPSRRFSLQTTRRHSKATSTIPRPASLSPSRRAAQHYVHGDVTPEAAKVFEDADSKGRAWQDIRKNGTLVAKVVNGSRVPIRRGPVSVDAEGTTLDPLTQKLNNLTEIIQASRGGGKPGVTPAIPPSDDLLENLQKSLDLVKKQRGHRLNAITAKPKAPREFLSKPSSAPAGALFKF